MAIYWNLVYHIPAGTAHSNETNFPTILSKSEKDTCFLLINELSKGKYFATLSSGTENLDLKLSH